MRWKSVSTSLLVHALPPTYETTVSYRDSGKSPLPPSANVVPPNLPLPGAPNGFSN